MVVEHRRVVLIEKQWHAANPDGRPRQRAI
jgi:hypothetical protein